MEDCNTTGIVIDEIYEFSAPRYYDFIAGESDDDVRNAELWFDTALAYAPSPFMMRIKSGRSVQLSSQCELGDAEQPTQVWQASESFNHVSTQLSAKQVTPMETHKETKEVSPLESPTVMNPNKSDEKFPGIQEHVANQSCEVLCDMISKDDNGSASKGPDLISEVSISKEPVTADICTPKPAIIVGKGVRATADSKRQQTSKKIASTIKNPLTLKSKIQSSTRAAAKPTGTRRDTSNMKSSVGTPNFVQENQPIKRQKLDDGKTRQILNIKPPSLPHKTRLGATTNTSKVSSSTAKPSKENRKMYVREPAAPYVSMAEMMKRFQSSLRKYSSSQEKLLTKPKEPEFVTSQRVRPMKSSAELEEEMMAKMPKFKARPFNKKILEAPTLRPLPKSQPPKPEFQEFHLETMERATKNTKLSSVVSVESGHQELASNQSCEELSDKISKDDNGSTLKGPYLISELSNSKEPLTEDICTPKSAVIAGKGVRASADSKRQHTVKKIASTLKNPSTMKSEIQSHTRAAKPAGIRRDMSNMKSSVGTPNFVQENQAIMRQKLDDGKTRQMYVREPAAPYVSMEEMMKKFQSSIRDMSLPQYSASQEKLTLTRPKEPKFITSQRVCLVKGKSSAELEEEMMAKMPKFKARPLNKKILEAPTLPSLPKSQPPKPEFQEFHLETMERANKNTDISSVVYVESGHQKSQWKPSHLTEPKTPALQTSLRVRPTRVESSLEIEREELEKVPKFKARPRNKKERGAEKERRLITELAQKQLEVERARVPKSSTLSLHH